METAIVIFGASGDLSARKLIPALYNNFKKGRLPIPVRIIGFARSPMSDEAFRDKMKEAIATFAQAEYDESTFREFARMLYYHTGDIEKADSFAELARELG
ncbi:MAG TPA: glucose-6-phosphate dehydrogenase, partial [Bacteroidota bacterium]|nr:glucose-6-phosphate dehydrogenase [Bacteroidota bacterium]